LTENLIIEWHI